MATAADRAKIVTISIDRLETQMIQGVDMHLRGPSALNQDICGHKFLDTANAKFHSSGLIDIWLLRTTIFPTRYANRITFDPLVRGTYIF